MAANLVYKLLNSIRSANPFALILMFMVLVSLLIVVANWGTLTK